MAETPTKQPTPPASPDSRRGIWLKIIIPVVIGLGVVFILFYKEFNAEALRSVSFTPLTVLGLCLAALTVVGRDGGMAWRFHVLTDGDLSWRQSIRTTFLCEFTSAITPSSVGGSALSMVFLNREGINLGRATTLTMTILFFDELFFVITCPVIVAITPGHDLFDFHGGEFEGIRLAFWIVYGLIFVWTLILFLGIIVMPRYMSRFLGWLFSFRLLRRWHASAVNLGENMAATSLTLRSHSLSWWIKGMAATTLSWVSRYLLVNALLFAFVPEASQFTAFARQFVVWSLLMFTPTPGGSGVSEWLFKRYYGDLIGSAGIVMVIALLWRLFSYYLYLFVGVTLIPRFLRSTKEARS